MSTDLIHYFILFCSGLLLLSIFAGQITSRVGVPLLLVFLGLGMLAGEDGPGGVNFDDFEIAYAVGAVSLAIVLFDGGLRTSMGTLRTAAWPALLLATFGVVITAAITAVAAHLLLGLQWIESLLMGSIVASTDAAAVFFLLNLRGTKLIARVRTTLEAEAGMNDPMAIFLTVSCVSLLSTASEPATWQHAGEFAAAFVVQIVGGAIAGFLGGHALVYLVNRLRLAAGLYPILALATALTVFGGTQALGASGFLAVYLCGIVLGNRRHRARQLIERFQDGIAWLSQIVMFVMLGLLVTPSDLLGYLVPAVGVAVVLIAVARPIAVVLCLLPFGFAAREHALISWIGLRGAVPIFLGTLPVLADLPDARLYFMVAFVVVLTSLLVQGWSINGAARQLKLALPPVASAPLHLEVDLPNDVGRDMAIFPVQEGSAAVRLHAEDVSLAAGAEVVAVIREGTMRGPGRIGQLAPGDQVMLLAPDGALPDLDRLFGIVPTQDREGRMLAALGEFAFPAEADLGELSRAYGFPMPAGDASQTVGDFVARRLRRPHDVGDRLRHGPVELIVLALERGRISKVGIELDPRGDAWWRDWPGRFQKIWRRLRRARRTSGDG